MQNAKRECPSRPTTVAEKYNSILLFTFPILRLPFAFLILRFSFSVSRFAFPVRLSRFPFAFRTSHPHSHSAFSCPRLSYFSASSRFPFSRLSFLVPISRGAYPASPGPFPFHFMHATRPCLFARFRACAVRSDSSWVRKMSDSELNG